MIDLHTHTNCSDGDYTPRQLVKIAANYGVNILSITDHDTIKAYDYNIISDALMVGVRLIPGVEFSTIDEMSNEKIHVVGLNIDINNTLLRKLCDELFESRRQAVMKTETTLLHLGIILRTDMLLKSGDIITKSHIAQDVIGNPINAPFFIKKYNKIPLQGTFIEDYLIKGKPAYIGNDDKLTTSRAVHVIKQSGGKAICAHPSFNVMRGFDLSLMQDLIIRNNFDGLEAVNIQYDKSNGDKKYDKVNEFIEFANHNNLLISGGSDFHSHNSELWGNHSELGLANEDYAVTEFMVEKILQ